MTTFPAWQPAFLAALAKTGNVLLAAQHVHLTRQNAYLARSTRNRTGEARLQALAFAQCWELALQESILPLQEALYHRAMHGVERQKPVYYKGKQVGVQKWTVYNDSLLITLLKSIDPDRYSRKAGAVPADSDDPFDLTRLSPEQFAEREALENLIDDLWCQVLNLLDPNSKQPPQPAPEPQIFSQPPVSSHVEFNSTPPSTPEPLQPLPTSEICFPIPVSSPAIEYINNALPEILKPPSGGSLAPLRVVNLARGLTPVRTPASNTSATTPMPEISSPVSVSSPIETADALTTVDYELSSALSIIFFFQPSVKSPRS